MREIKVGDLVTLTSSRLRWEKWEELPKYYIDEYKKLLGKTRKVIGLTKGSGDLHGLTCAVVRDVCFIVPVVVLEIVESEESDETKVKAQQKLKVGDFVKANEDIKILHKTQPYFYPKAGTLGLVVRGKENNWYRIKWEKGSTSMDDEWPTQEFLLEKYDPSKIKLNTTPVIKTTNTHRCYDSNANLTKLIVQTLYSDGKIITHTTTFPQS